MAMAFLAPDLDLRHKVEARLAFEVIILGYVFLDGDAVFTAVTDCHKTVSAR